VLQCESVAVCCSLLQCVVVCCVEVCCSVLQCVALFLHCLAVSRSVLPKFAKSCPFCLYRYHCSVLQGVAGCFKVL